MKEYTELLDSQKFYPEDLDYEVLARHANQLSTMAQIGNSCISVFDLYKRNHPFVSNNFEQSLKYDLTRISSEDTAYFDLHIHPSDYLSLMQSGTVALRMCLANKGVAFDYKLINEYRIDIAGQWVRVIEQKQVLETDKYGNVWLALSVLDISPVQDPFHTVKSQLFNFKTGEIRSCDVACAGEQESPSLTPREKQVLQSVRGGYLSKEIADQMVISVHTVNTYRQRILEKLGANNSLEAIQIASRLGLID